MNILLLSMPDSFEHMPEVVIRMPNGALTSLAGNVDPHHKTAVADLILVQRRVRETVRRLVREFEPDVVGLSVMTFQRQRRCASLNSCVRCDPPYALLSEVTIPASLPRHIRKPGVDFIVRGEGEITFRRAATRNRGGPGLPAQIAGLSYRSGDGFRHNPDRAVSHLAGEEIRPPRRDARVLRGYTMMGRQVDVVETSRGCTFDCSFCSIIEMRGRNFHTYDLDRVIADIRDAYDRGARTIFLVDDNITLNIQRFEPLCRKIVEAKLNALTISSRR